MQLSHSASGEFVLKVLPRFTKSVQILSALTITFGPLLAFTMNDGPPNQFNLVSPWSICIVIGASIGITAFLVVFLLLTPTARKLDRAIRQMQQSPRSLHPPS